MKADFVLDGTTVGQRRALIGTMQSMCRNRARLYRAPGVVALLPFMMGVRSHRVRLKRASLGVFGFVR